MNKLRIVSIVCFGLISIFSLLNSHADVYSAREAGLHFSLGEVVGLVSGVVSLFLVIIGFFLKRSVFGEIDKKQDKLLCEQIEETRCRDREEFLKRFDSGDREFKSLHNKMNRVMWKMNLAPDIGEGRDKDTNH